MKNVLPLSVVVLSVILFATSAESVPYNGTPEIKTPKQFIPTEEEFISIEMLAKKKMVELGGNPSIKLGTSYGAITIICPTIQSADDYILLNHDSLARNDLSTLELSRATTSSNLCRISPKAWYLFAVNRPPAEVKGYSVVVGYVVMDYRRTRLPNGRPGFDVTFKKRLCLRELQH